MGDKLQNGVRVTYRALGGQDGGMGPGRGRQSLVCLRICVSLQKLP